MATQQHYHTVSAFKVERPSGEFFRWSCTCGGRGSSDQSSEDEALASGEKHAKKMRPRPKWGP